MQSNLQSSTYATDGWIATVGSVFDKATDTLFSAGKEYLQDQWGLQTGGNSVDQNLYNPKTSEKNAGNTANTTAKPVGFIDLNVSPNAVIALIVGGVVLYFAFIR